MSTKLVLECLGRFRYDAPNVVQARLEGEFGHSIVTEELINLWNGFWAVTDPPDTEHHGKCFIEKHRGNPPHCMVVPGAESFTLEDFAEVLRGLISLEIVTRESDGEG